MPKIKSYTPRWLTEPALGHQLFASPTGDAARLATLSPFASKKKAEPGPRRTVARRGTEVFVANGKEIRWGDLAFLKDSWEETEQARGRRRSRDDDGLATNGSSHHGDGYRALKTPVADDIQQLVMSPLGDFLAVMTSHTVHICVLPDSSHLTADDTSPLKPRYFTLGPTTHVTSRSPVVSAVWHPLGVNGSALVTVTKDAVVRVWELSPVDRWSFDAPTLAIDLKKLADGTSLEQDFGATGTTTNKTFSPDSFDMEVASACFGSRNSGGWVSMTLWIAMRGGDVYALCPLLPHRWSPPQTLIPSLSVSIVAKVAVLEDDAGASPQAKLLAQQQLEWMSDLDNQEPKIVDTGITEPLTQIYNRPTQPGIVPRLQGPFELRPDEDSQMADDAELCDIMVIGEKTDMQDVMTGEEGDVDDGMMGEEGLSLSVVCLLSTDGIARICLDTQGVEAQWLPPRNKIVSASQLSSQAPPSLLTFQLVQYLRQREVRLDVWSTFSPDVTSRYSFYITHPSGITYISLSPWVFRLEQELEAGSNERANFRIELLVQAPSTRERVYTHTAEGALAACIAFRDPDLGYFLLSATHHAAVALQFESPDDDFNSPSALTPTLLHDDEEEESKQLDLNLARPAFQMPEEFNQRSDLGHTKNMLFSSRHQFMKDQEVRLSPATLEIFSNVHRLVGAESGRLNKAVAQLYTKLESLPEELREQVTKADLVKQRIEKISGKDVDSANPLSDNERLQDRLDAARRRQESLASRMEDMKRSINRAAGRELSEKEVAWMREVSAIEASIAGSGDASASPSRSKPLLKRLEELKALSGQLLSQAQSMQKNGGGEGEAKEGDAGATMRSSASSLKIPSDIRKQKVAQVMALLDRETALVDAVKNRLERLAIG